MGNHFIGTAGALAPLDLLLVVVIKITNDKRLTKEAGFKPYSLS